MLGHRRLMGPGPDDAGPCERQRDLLGHPARPRHALAGAGSDLFDMHQPAGPRAAAQDARGGYGVPCAGMPHAGSLSAARGIPGQWSGAA